MVTSPVSPAPTPSPPLLGRAAELTAILGLLDGLRTEGRGLVIEGETGVGKTALVEAVVEEARRRGHRILRCTGLRSSSTIGYTALHELLHPILPFAKALPPRHRSAILGAFGLDDAEAEFPLVALGALGLVEEAAAPGAVVIAGSHEGVSIPGTRERSVEDVLGWSMDVRFGGRKFFRGSPRRGQALPGSVEGCRRDVASWS